MAIKGLGSKKKTSLKKPEKKSGNSWMMRGKASKKAMDREEARVVAAREESDKLWRWRISKDDMDEDFKITFLDGDLDADGQIDMPTFYEHTFIHLGKWANFCCTKGQGDTGECPICDGGNNPSLVGALTVIDHNPYTAKDGKTYVNRKKLFIMKRGTMKLLTKIANKREGLAGATFEVSRSGEMSPAVGNFFEFEQKNTLTDLVDDFGDQAEVADYDEEIVYHTAEELVKLGIGSITKGIGGESEPADDEMGDEL